MAIDLKETAKKLEKQYSNLVGEDGFKTDVALTVPNETVKQITITALLLMGVVVTGYFIIKKL